MSSCRILLLGMVWLSVQLTSFAQPYPIPVPIKQDPLLFLRFEGPDGLKVTMYQGPKKFDLKAKEKIGVRPGYIYRLEVTGFPKRPGLTLYPTLEVYGSLKLPAELSLAEFPVPIVFGEIDIEKILDGSLLTKVYYLEDPKKARPERGKGDLPIEVQFHPRYNLVLESAKLGRPMLVFRLGNRTYESQELAQQSIPGTVLFPNEKSLGLPPIRPMLKWQKVPLYDPLLGPKKLAEECLLDGGDRDLPVGYRPGGKLGGLDPEDTVAEYRNSKGVKKIAISNRVCVCVPRFGVLRTEITPFTKQDLRMPQGTRRVGGPDLMTLKVPPLGVVNYDELLAIKGRRSPTEVYTLTRTSIFGKVEGVEQIVDLARVADITGICKKPQGIDKPLLLKKWANKKSAKIGDTVTYYLRYANVGDKDITDVVVSDSLTGRLEYVPGSAKSSRNAVFTMRPNESGSLILRWQITGTLKAGENGMLRFQARIR